MPKPKKSLEERFWQKVNKTEACWLWTASTHEFGYGVIGCPDRPGRTLRAHRVSWEWAHGEIPKGLLVLHKCDVPACVNPDHLFLGTHKDNSDDKVSKGRQAKIGNGRGEESPNSKLTWEKVRDIRKRSESGETQRSIAARYGIDKSNVAAIIRKKTWKEKDREDQ